MSGSPWGCARARTARSRRCSEHLGLYVNRLIRLSFGPFQLGELAEGEVEEVRSRVLRDQLGEAARPRGRRRLGGRAQPREVVTHARARAGRTSRRDQIGRSGARGERGRARASRAVRAPPEPRRDRPAPSARPHVSALRAERPSDGRRAAQADHAAPRRRTARVAPSRSSGSPSRARARTQGEGGTSRNARNFARDRRDALVSLRPTAERAAGRGARPAETRRAAASAPGPHPRGFGAGPACDGTRAQGGKARSDRVRRPSLPSPAAAVAPRAGPDDRLAQARTRPARARAGEAEACASSAGASAGGALRAPATATIRPDVGSPARTAVRHPDPLARARSGSRRPGDRSFRRHRRTRAWRRCRAARGRRCSSTTVPEARALIRENWKRSALRAPRVFFAATRPGSGPRRPSRFRWRFSTRLTERALLHAGPSRPERRWLARGRCAGRGRGKRAGCRGRRSRLSSGKPIVRHQGDTCLRIYVVDSGA